MATNQVYAYSKEKTREWPVPANTDSGTPVVSISNEPGVTITARGSGVTRTVNLPDGSTITRIDAPVGVRSDSAVVAVDGTWALPVIGATAATPKNTPVYAVVAGGAVTSLTLTEGTNTPFGVVDSYLGKASAEDTAVKIGVFA